MKQNKKFFKFKDSSIELGNKTLIMGILNVTPDSFSDGNKYISVNAAVERACEMLEEGADIIDIGGESTRPGAPSVSLSEEINRVIPVINKLKDSKTECIISVDTTKHKLAEEAILAGADIINDISGLQFDPLIAEIAAKHQAGLILMHTKGTPSNMMQEDQYENLIEEVKEFLFSAAKKAEGYGLAKENIMLDPGIGFAKNHLQNIELINNIKAFKDLKYPLLVGPSRKSFIGEILKQKNPTKRIFGTAAVIAWLVLQGVECVRVHDIIQMNEVVSTLESIRKIELPT